MARTRRSRCSYGAGEWRRNRVRAFPDPKTGLFQLEWRENRRRLTRSLGHREWVKAKKQADEFAAGGVTPLSRIVKGTQNKPPTITLARLALYPVICARAVSSESVLPEKACT